MVSLKYLNPVKYYYRIKYCCYKILFYKAKKNNRLLNELKDRFSGKRCFILGNGPSLKVSDLEKLKDEYTFASNKIYLLFEDTDWRPYFYAVEDHLVAKQNYETINSLNLKFKFFPKIMLKSIGKIFKNSIIFKLIYKDINSPHFPSFSFNAVDGLYWGSTIVYTQLQLACHMGFSEIYLLGVDFNYKVPVKNCDNNVLISEGEVNHFHKDYRKPGEKWHIPNLDVHEKSFTRAREEAEKNGVKIYNATRGGKLEIFTRVDFDSLF